MERRRLISQAKKKASAEADEQSKKKFKDIMDKTRGSIKGKTEEEKLRNGKELESLRLFFNGLNYNMFLTVVTLGNIRGKHLIALCSGSRKLREYGNRSFQLVDNKGKLIGLPRDQHLFRLLLDKKGIPIPFGKTPRKTYIEKTIGGRVWAFGYDGFEKNVYYASRSHPTLRDIIQVKHRLNDDAYCLDNKGRVWLLGNTGSISGLGNNYQGEFPAMIPTLKNIVQIDCVSLHTLCLDNQGQVWGHGWNDKGQLGLEDIDTITENVPFLNPFLKDIIQVSCGKYHSVCLDQQGKVWVFGLNDNFQLGLGNTQNKNIPTLNPYLKDIVQVNCGNYHSLCLDDQGRVWGFGSNYHYQLGLQDIHVGNIPVLIHDLEGIIQVSARHDHSLCLDNQGRVWSFGYGISDGMMLQNSKTLSYQPLLIPELENIVQVSADRHKSLCLDGRGKIWTIEQGKKDMNRIIRINQITSYENDETDDGNYKNYDVKRIPYVKNVIQIDSGGEEYYIFIKDRNY
jgi:hypothetical protein